MSVRKLLFLKNTGFLLSAREKILNNFKSKIFSTKNLESKPEPTVFDIPKHTKLTNFGKKITRDESNINNVIFNEYFKYQNPSNLLKDL